MRIFTFHANRLIFCVFLHCVICFGAVVHKSYSHGLHDHKNLNNERESDGAYSPQEQPHYDDSGKHLNIVRINIGVVNIEFPFGFN